MAKKKHGRNRGKKQPVRGNKKKRNTLIAVGIILIFAAVVIVFSLTTATREARGTRGEGPLSLSDISTPGMAKINLDVGGMY
jgi:flagellar basal body-associated protein FliL